MDHVILEYLNGLCKLSGDWAVGVDGQPVATQMQDVHWYPGGLSVSWHVKCLAMFGRWLFGEDLSYEYRELMPAAAFLDRLLGISHWQVAFPVCAVAVLAVNVSSLLKRKILLVWIVTVYALSQSMHYVFVPCCHKALL